MTLKKFVYQLAPSFIKKRAVLIKENIELNLNQKLVFETNNLKCNGDVSVEEMFDSDNIEKTWRDVNNEINIFNIPDGTGGINPSGCRAIYYLICKLKPSSVLEVGTHIGASTLHIAAALNVSHLKNKEKASLTTVDIRDVNSPVKKPWLKHGSRHSPIEMVNKLGYGSFVKFVTNASLNYFTKCDQKFDFIFLDGSHAARIVYQEVSAALKLLNENGIILLHDYFPGLKPFSNNGSVIPGPFLAIERVAKENQNLAILPLGKLPWPTKETSNLTSLAMLLKNK